MTSSLDAKIFYGFDFGEELFDWEDDVPEWFDENDDPELDEVYAKLKGWAELPFPEGAPDNRMPAGMAYRDWDKQQRIAREAFNQTEGYKAWSANRNEMRKLIEACPVAFESYGVPAYWSHRILVVTASLHMVSNACDTMPLITQDNALIVQWREQLDAYLELMEIPAPKDQEPSWLIALSYG